MGCVCWLGAVYFEKRIKNILRENIYTTKSLRGIPFITQTKRKETEEKLNMLHRNNKFNFENVAKNFANNCWFLRMQSSKSICPQQP